MLLMFPPFYPPSRAKIPNMCLVEVSNFHFWPSFSCLGGLLGSLGLHLGYFSLSLSIFYRFWLDFWWILDLKINEKFRKNSALFWLIFLMFFLCSVGLLFLSFILRKYQFYIDFYSVSWMLAVVVVAIFLLIFCCSWPSFLVPKFNEKSIKNE